MLNNTLENILDNVHYKKPIIHCITNYVTMNDCANMVLAAGGTPIMADDVSEVKEITSMSNALILNMGTPNKSRIKAMILAGRKANELGIPVVLDPVGVGVSEFRRNALKELMSSVKFSVIKGNLSEIRLIAIGINNNRGVDADTEAAPENGGCDSYKSVLEFSKELAKRTGSVIVVTGETDIVTDSNKSFFIKNGTPYMGKITGAGCMLTSLIGIFLGANKEMVLEAAVAATGAMGLCGEAAFEKVCERNEVTGSFRTYLIDAMSLLDSKTLEEGIRLESK